MQLSDNFSLEELIASESAARSGIDNMPPPDVMPNMFALAQGLERVRDALGGLPIHVNSGFRSARLNKLVGGAANSQHMSGLAADIVCPKFGTPLDVCRAIVSAGIEIDQVIHEFGKWCHVSFPAHGRPPRRQLLTIASAAQGYMNGLQPVA
jgi:hypothetical protein